MSMTALSNLMNGVAVKKEAAQLVEQIQARPESFFPLCQHQ